MPLILDGIIDYDTLKQIGKNKEWITNMLIEDNVELENVFYAFYRKNKLYIIKDNDLRKWLSFFLIYYNINLKLQLQ